MIKQLENATTFQEIFKLYIKELGGADTTMSFEKHIAKKSFMNLAEFLDNSPLGVSQWAQIDKDKERINNTL
jgi:aminopeptidase N